MILDEWNTLDTGAEYNAGDGKRFTIARVPDNSSRYNQIIKYSLVERGTEFNYSDMLYSTQTMYSTYWVRPTMMNDRLDVDPGQIKYESHESPTTPPTIFRLRSYNEILSIICNKDRSFIDLVMSEWQKVYDKINIQGTSNRYIPDNIFYYSSHWFKGNGDIARIYDFYGRSHDSQVSTDDYVAYCLEDRIFIPFKLIPLVFDLSPSDIIMIPSYIKQQIVGRRDRSLSDRILSHRDVNYLMGCLVVMEVETPDPDKVGICYYPRAWEIDAGSRRSLYAFIASSKGIRKGWRSGIFSPGGNLIPMDMIPGKKIIQKILTKKPVGLFPISDVFRYSVKTYIQDKAATDNNISSGGYSFDGAPVEINNQVTVTTLPDETNGDLCVSCINHGEICETCTYVPILATPALRADSLFSASGVPPGELSISRIVPPTYNISNMLGIQSLPMPELRSMPFINRNGNVYTREAMDAAERQFTFNRPTRHAGEEQVRLPHEAILREPVVPYISITNPVINNEERSLSYDIVFNRPTRSINVPLRINTGHISVAGLVDIPEEQTSGNHRLIAIDDPLDDGGQE